MNERQKRLKESYEYVRKKYDVHTQEDFAKTLHKSRNAITLALNGNEKYLTDKLFESIFEAYPGVFNLHYLLTGEGSLLAIGEKVQNEDVTISESSLINAALAGKDDAIESLKRELRTKDDLIQSLRDQLAAKDQLIAEQKARLIDYRRIIDSHPGTDTYPFPIGAAEPTPNPSTK